MSQFIITTLLCVIVLTAMEVGLVCENLLYANCLIT